eukprot:358937-Chlamydomonas_euryale.AAC.18
MYRTSSTASHCSDPWQRTSSACVPALRPYLCQCAWMTAAKGQVPQRTAAVRGMPTECTLVAQRQCASHQTSRLWLNEHCSSKAACSANHYICWCAHIRPGCSLCKLAAWRQNMARAEARLCIKLQQPGVSSMPARCADGMCSVLHRRVTARDLVFCDH